MPVTNEEIVRRLRAFKGHGTNLTRTAANRIEQLEAELQQAEADRHTVTRLAVRMKINSAEPR